MYQENPIKSKQKPLLAELIHIITPRMGSAHIMLTFDIPRSKTKLTLREG